VYDPARPATCGDLIRQGRTWSAMDTRPLDHGWGPGLLRVLVITSMRLRILMVENFSTWVHYTLRCVCGCTFGETRMYAPPETSELFRCPKCGQCERNDE